MEYKLSDNNEQLRHQIAQLQQELQDLRGDMEDTNTPMVRYAEANGLSNPAPTAIKFRRILKGHYGKIYSMHWGVNSKHLVSASQDGKLLIWNAHTTHKVHAIPLKSSWVMTCAMSTEGSPESANSSQYVACGGLDNLCTVYKLPSPDDAPTAKNKPLAELAHHEGYLSCCRFIRDEKIITSSGDSTCILWDIATGQVMRSFTEHTGDVMSVSIRDDNSFVSGACDASARFWDFRDARAVAQYNPESKDGAGLKYKAFPGHDSDINSVQMFPDGNAFASGSDDSTCRLFDIRAFRQLQRFGNDKILCGITSVDFSMSGKYLIAGYDDEKCYLWDTISGKCAGEVSGHDNRVSCLGVSPDGKALATGSWDTYLKVWA